MFKYKLAKYGKNHYFFPSSNFFICHPQCDGISQRVADDMQCFALMRYNPFRIDLKREGALRARIEAMLLFLLFCGGSCSFASEWAVEGVVRTPLHARPYAIVFLKSIRHNPDKIIDIIKKL